MKTLLRTKALAIAATLLGIGFAHAQTRPLNDTGTNSCDAAIGGGSFGAVHDPCISSDPQGQDAQYGRDADARSGQLEKIGAGNSGFDFTKISMSGLPLASTAVLGTSPDNWACTRDNVTGLVWEIKLNDTNHFRHLAYTFSWYSSASPDGSKGTPNGGTCLVPGRCDSENYVADVNTSALCGFTDWRMPTAKELSSIVTYGFAQPVADPTFFPNTRSTAGTGYWSSLTSALDASSAWWVDFMRGDVEVLNYLYKPFSQKSNARSVRLVRGSQ